MSEWFESWFGEEYLALYPHRDEQEAERAVAMLASLDVPLRGRVLDLACGAGRHLAALRRRETNVAGLDLSLPLLRTAQRAGERRLIRGDIRALPLRTGWFDTVLNLFTSFGYFDDDAQHQAVLGEVARVLRPGGRFVLDFLNAPQVRTSLVRRDSKQVGGSRVVQERELSADGRYVVKSIHISGESRSFMERVRLFERDDLETMMRNAGLGVERVVGDYEGAPYASDSPRCLVIARKP